MISLLTLALLAAEPNAEPIRIAVPPLKLVNLDPKLADFYSGHLAQQLTFQGVRTLTNTEIAAVLGLERQKQMMGAGCGDNCSADMGEVLGVDGVLVGSVTRLEKTFQLDVKVVAAGSGAPLASASALSEDNDRLVGTFVVVAEQLAKQLAAKLNRTLDTSKSVELVQGPSTIKRLSFVPALIGVAGGVTGAIFLGIAGGNYGRLTTRRGEPLTEAQGQALASQGRTFQTVGWVCVGVGIAGLAAAAGMFLFGGNEVVRAGVALTPDFQGLTLSGSF